MLCVAVGLTASADMFIPMLENYLEPIKLEDKFSNVMQGLTYYDLYRNDFAQPQDTARPYHNGNKIYILCNPDISARLKTKYKEYKTSYGTKVTDSVELSYDYVGRLIKSKDWHNSDEQVKSDYYASWVYEWDGNRLKKATYIPEYDDGYINTTYTYTVEKLAKGFKSNRHMLTDGPSLGIYEEDCYEIYDENNRLIEFYDQNRPYSPLKETFRLDTKGRVMDHSSYTSYANNDKYQNGERYEYLDIPEYDVAIASKTEEFMSDRKTLVKTTYKRYNALDNGTVEFVTEYDEYSNGIVYTQRIHNFGKFKEEEGKYNFYPDSVKFASKFEYDGKTYDVVTRCINIEYSRSKKPIRITDNHSNWDLTRYDYVWDADGNLTEGTWINYNKTDNIWQRTYGFKADYAPGTHVLLSTTAVNYSNYEEDPYGVASYVMTETYEVDPRFPGKEICVGGSLYAGEGMLLSRNNETYIYDILRVPESGVAEVKIDDNLFKFDGETVRVDNKDCRQISVYNLSGALLNCVNDSQVDVSDLTNGIYIISATIGDKLTTIKIAK